MGDPCLLAESKTEPTPPGPGPPDLGGKGPVSSLLGAGMSLCHGWWVGLGRLGSFHFSSFKLHASSQSCLISPLCTNTTLNEPGVIFHPLQAPRHVVLGTLPWGRPVETALCTESKCQPLHRHHWPPQQGGQPAASQDTSFSHMPGSHHPAHLLSRWRLESPGGSLTTCFARAGSSLRLVPPSCLAGKSWIPTHVLFLVLKRPPEFLLF